MTLDRVDLRMALAAVEYYRRGHALSRRPIPPAADRLADHLHALMSVRGHESAVPQQDWLTTAELAARLNLSQRHARRIATQVGTKIGRQWLTPADALPED